MSTPIDETYLTDALRKGLIERSGVMAPNPLLKKLKAAQLAALYGDRGHEAAARRLRDAYRAKYSVNMDAVVLDGEVITSAEAAERGCAGPGLVCFLCPRYGGPNPMKDVSGLPNPFADDGARLTGGLETLVKADLPEPSPQSQTPWVKPFTGPASIPAIAHKATKKFVLPAAAEGGSVTIVNKTGEPVTVSPAGGEPKPGSFDWFKKKVGRIDDLGQGLV